MLLSLYFASYLVNANAHNETKHPYPSIRFEVLPKKDSTNRERLEKFNLLVTKDHIDISQFKEVWCAGRPVRDHQGFRFSIRLTPDGSQKMQAILHKDEIKSVVLVFDDIYFKFTKPENIKKWANTLTFSTNLSATKLGLLENEVNKAIENSLKVRKGKETIPK